MIVNLPDIIRTDGSLNLEELPEIALTRNICLTGQAGAGKASLCNGLAEFYSKQEKLVIVAKSPCYDYFSGWFHNAIGRDGHEDLYTEQLIFCLADGLLSNYMTQISGHCDYFLCQRGPIDQYAIGVTRSGKSYSEIYKLQKPERLAKFDMYIHLNCEPMKAWERRFNVEGEDKYEYADYLVQQVRNTQKLFFDIMNGHQKELNFLRSSNHVYIDTTKLSIPQVLVKAIEHITDYYNVY